MMLLDTNLISEPPRPAPHPGVVAWMDAQPLETLFISAVTVAELRACIASLPAGRRRDSLLERVESQVLPVFTGRVLAFDLAATQPYADLLARCRSKGHAIGQADACIAAIAVTHGMTVATRDAAAFKASGVAVINPWEQSASGR